VSRRTLTVDEALHDYVIEHGVREHPELTALREATRTHPRAGMQISPEQGQLMRLLVQMIGARRTIEIGVFTGYSALAVALALPDDGRILACDISDEFTSVGRPFCSAPASRTRSSWCWRRRCKRSTRAWQPAKPVRTTSPSSMPTRSTTTATTSAACSSSAPAG
jgi:hypothetical protein